MKFSSPNWAKGRGIIDPAFREAIVSRFWKQNKLTWKSLSTVAKRRKSPPNMRD
jgi:hypothetical protein